MAGGRLPERWAAVHQPVLVMDGGDSPDFMRTAVQNVVEALPNARRQTIPGQTHAYEVDVVVPVLTDWLAA
jgi:pimeloyl-ACP methyl ester carboxylesterase